MARFRNLDELANQVFVGVNPMIPWGPRLDRLSFGKVLEKMKFVNPLPALLFGCIRFHAERDQSKTKSGHLRRRTLRKELAFLRHQLVKPEKKFDDGHATLIQVALCEFETERRLVARLACFGCELGPTAVRPQALHSQGASDAA